MDCLIEVGAVSHICVHYPTGRKKTEAARTAGLRQIIPLLLVEGTTELIMRAGRPRTPRTGP